MSETCAPGMFRTCRALCYDPHTRISLGRERKVKHAGLVFLQWSPATTRPQLLGVGFVRMVWFSSIGYYWVTEPTTEMEMYLKKKNKIMFMGIHFNSVYDLY